MARLFFFKLVDINDEAENERFLQDFINNKKWMTEDNEERTSGIVGDWEESDDDENDRADRFETAFNFRFEEEGGGSIQTYSRAQPGTMRRVDDKRKKDRESRKERKAKERAGIEAQLKRLKVTNDFLSFDRFRLN